MCREFESRYPLQNFWPEALKKLQAFLCLTSRHAKTPALTDGGNFFGIVAMLITACE